MADDESPDLGDELDRKRREMIEPLEFDRLRTEPAFHHIARAIIELCDVSMAHVSVMEDDNQCVIGRVGFDRDSFVRDHSFCAHTLANRQLTVIEDAREDERFAGSPYVTESPFIRFYAGLPLDIQGIPVGTICAMDGEPREFDEHVRATLQEFARIVERYLETKVVATSERDPRQRLAAELTIIAALSAMLDRRAGDDGLGDLIDTIKDSVNAGYDAIGDWIEAEHEASFD